MSHKSDGYWSKRGNLPHRRFRHVLIRKLILVLFASGLLINCIVGGFYRLIVGQEVHTALKKNVSHYSLLLANEIGSPPDTLKAKEIANRYSLRIQIRGPDHFWNSFQDRESEQFITKFMANDLHSESIADGKNLSHLGWKMGRAISHVKVGQHDFIFVTDFKQLVNNHATYFALVLCVLSFVFVMAFLIIKHLLSPLKKLSAGVERLGQGELGHQIPVCSHDEFGDLAISFNTMSSRLATLVKAREQLLLDVSHELRSPITRIKVALEMLPEKNAKAVASIQDDLLEMENMISEILEAARLDSVYGKLNLSEVKLQTLLNEIITIASKNSPGVIFVGNTYDTVISMDKNRIQKVLNNVIENALKFSQNQTRPVEVSLENLDAEWIIRVKDYGQGIPPSEIVNLFEPFYRVDRSRSRDTGGYGLGLSLCKKIMEAHGGRIEVASVEGKGTQVSISYPANTNLSG